MEETTDNTLPRILIADDEEGIRFAMKETLAEEGYEIEEAADGNEAVDLFRPEKFDLVILDYRMPTIVESPPIDTSIVEAPDPNGPFGAKEAGEGSLSAFLPALTNAIADAIGLRLDELPASPDRVLEAIVARRRAERVRRTAKPAVQEAD